MRDRKTSGDGRIPRGLFLNTAKANCSIFESGRMVYECIRLSERYTLDYLTLDMFDTQVFAEKGIIRLTNGIADSEAYPADYDFWVFNWHFITMAPMIPVHVPRILPGVKFAVVLELAPGDPLTLISSDAFDGYIALEPNLKRTASIFPFPRPLEGEPRRPAKSTDPRRPPIIGSFGFGTPGKGFELLVEAVNREFEQATVRVNIPPGTYTANTIQAGEYAAHIERVCRQIAKPGVEVEFTRNFLAPEEVIDWCGGNDLNCFMYTRKQPGLSATTDQAILSGRPLLTLGNDTFRHIHPYIPPYPEISLKAAMATTTEAVLRMQREWAKDRFRQTFEEMLASFGVLSRGAVAPTVELPTERAMRVLHADMSGRYRNDVLEYASRLHDALSRTGNWEVLTAPLGDADDLRAVSRVVAPDIVILSSVDAAEPAALADAVKGLDCPKLVVTERVADWSTGSFAVIQRRPIIPFFTVLVGLREGPPTIWLIGFGDPASSLEQAINKIALDLPAATILVEAPAAQRDSIATRLDALSPKLVDKPGIRIRLEPLPVIGVQVINNVAAASLIVVHSDPARTHEIESYASLCIITERSVVFARGAAGAFAERAVFFEDHSVSALIELGIGAQIKLLADMGEWQVAADIRAVCRRVQTPENSLGRLFKRVWPKARTTEAVTAASILSVPGDNAFVHAAFWALLGRAPDPDGLTYYSSQLRAGRHRGSMLIDINNSPEARARGAELSGMNAVRRDDDGCDGPKVRGVFQDVGSSTGTEPTRKTATWILSLPGDESFVEAAYWALLDRAPDADGLAYCLSLLRNEGRRRESILLAISQSPEARDRGFALSGIDVVAAQEAEASANGRSRHQSVRQSLVAIHKQVSSLNAEMVALSSAVPAKLPPLRLAPSAPVPVLDDAATATRARERCVFILAGVQNRTEAVPTELRELSKAWTAHGRVRLVVWNIAKRKFSLLDERASSNDCLLAWETLDQENCPSSGWLVSPQSLHRDHDSRILLELELIMEARRLGLRTAFVFHGAEPLRREGDGRIARAFESYIQALLLADVVLPTSEAAENELVAIFTQHHLATWGPRIETVPWPGGVEGRNAAWPDYVRVVDHLLSEAADPARRIKSLYYWIEDAATPGQIELALRLARALGEHGVLLVPIAWDRETRSLTTALDRVAPASISWGKWIDPETSGAPEWIVAPAGMTSTVIEALDLVSSRGLRLAVLAGTSSSESSDRAALSSSQRKEFEGLTRADKVFCLSEAHYEEFHRFLLSWRGKVHSAEDRFKFLAAPAGEPERPTMARLQRARPSPSKGLVWGWDARPDIVPRIMRAAEQVASAPKAPRLSLTIIGRADGQQPVDTADGAALCEVSWRNRDQAVPAMADANFMIHLGSPAAREPEVMRALWAGIPCVVPNSDGQPLEPSILQVDFDDEKAIVSTIDRLLTPRTNSRPTKSWMDFGHKLLTDLATDRLRDACVPLRNSNTDLDRAFPSLITKRPKLSVCLSTYNRAGWVKRNLENIYSQVSSEREDVEIFVVDNTSPDNTPEVVGPYLRKSNFRYHRNEKNVGMLGNLAVTAQRARGEYIWIFRR